MMMDSIVIGAGQAGLGVSFFLKKKGFEHIVFERGRIGESWLSMRWDSFKLNTPNFMNVLPDFPYKGTETDSFEGVNELIQYFQKYVEHYNLPVRTGTTVLAVNRAEDNNHFIVKIKNGRQSEETVISRTIVVASGILQTPKLPAVHSKVPITINSLHSAEYRNSDSLPHGAVVIVGSGQTGCQIAEDLLSAGRTVYLCTSKVGRVPRRYRGKDILEWWINMKFWDVKYDQLEDKSIARTAQPQVSGVGRYGHTVSLQCLADKGAVIMGSLSSIEGDSIIVKDDAAAHIQFADGFSRRIKDDIDTYLERNGIKAPPPENDPADVPDPDSRSASKLQKINIRGKNISTIIWATGFKGNFNWLNLPVIDDEGNPIHQRGISPVEGLYFMGFPWLSSRKSGIIYGIEEDARFIADEISARLG